MVQPSERLERAKEQARLYHSLQSIPEDIQSCLLTIVQYGWSPDQVRSSYCLVREHFGASGTTISHVPMDTHIELPAGPPEFSSPSSMSVGESGPATTYATNNSLFESIYGRDQATMTPGREPTLHNAVHDTGKPFASPVSAAASKPGSGHDFAMPTPTSSSQQYPGSFPFADSPQLGNTLAFTGAGLNIQPSGPLYGLGLTQSPGLMPNYIMGLSGAAMPPVIPTSDMTTASSTLSTWSEASPSFKPSTDLHSPPFTPNSSEQPNKRQRKLRKEVKRITKPLQPPRPPRRATHPPHLSDDASQQVQVQAQPRSVMALSSPRPPMPGTPFPTSSPYLPTSYWTPMPSPPHVLQSSPGGGGTRRGSASDPAAPRPRAISSPLHRFPSTVYDGSYPSAESEPPFPVTSA